MAEPGTSILPLKDMLDLYLSTSQITQTYLSWYATVALAIAGYIATNRDTITTRTKGMIAFVFFFFSIGDLLAVANKQSLHSALAYEISEMVTAKGNLVISSQLKANLETTCSIPFASAFEYCLYSPSILATVSVFAAIFLCIMIVIFFGGLGGRLRAGNGSPGRRA